ncbi:HPP family protein [Candidatus Omnitrophota bacterium]
MTVNDVVTKKVITVKRSTTLAELLKLFKKFHTFPLAPVVEEGGRLVGVVSFRNLIELLLPRRPAILKTVPFLDEEIEDIFDTDLTEEMGSLLVVDDFMETKFMSVEESVDLKDVYQLFKIHSIDQLPVVDKENKLTGMVGVFDIIIAIFKDKGIE